MPKRIINKRQLLIHQSEITGMRKVPSIAIYALETWINYFEKHNAHLVDQVNDDLLKLRTQHLKHEVTDKGIVFAQGKDGKGEVKEGVIQKDYEIAEEKLLNEPITINIL